MKESDVRRHGLVRVVPLFAAALLAAVGIGWSASAPSRASGREPAKEVVKWEYATLATETFSCYWATAGEEIRAGDLTDLAKKLRIRLKEDGTYYAARIAVLNHLGAQGWELVSLTGRETDLMYTFKRRVP